MERKTIRSSITGQVDIKGPLIWCSKHAPALFLQDLSPGHKVYSFTQIFPTREFETFPDALEAVAQEEVFQTNTPSAAAFACAGPVASNKCEMTNLDWTIDGDYLSATHGIRCGLSVLLL